MRINSIANIVADVIIAASLLVFALLAPIAISEAYAQSGQLVQQIEIVGAERIDSDTIKSEFGIEEGQRATPAQINAGLRRLHASGHFADISIDRQGNKLVINVTENPSINQIAFEGNNRIDDDALLIQIGSRSLEPFTEAQANEDADRIVELYRQSGRHATSVVPKIIKLENSRVNLVFEIDEGEKSYVSSISFIGNEHFSNFTLKREIHTSERAWYRFLNTTDIYDPNQLEFDKELLRRFYLSEGFADFEVSSATAELAPNRTDFHITFTIREGDRYKFGDISLNSTLSRVPADEFTDLISIDSGDYYDASAIGDIIHEIKLRAGELGYAFVDIIPLESKNRVEDIVDLVFELRRGNRQFVERIIIEGNVRTLDRVIRREMEIEEGDPFNSYLIQRSRSKIQALGFFRSVELTAEPGTTSDQVVLRIKVEEQSTGSFNLGISYASDDQFGGTVSIAEKNFLGRGQLVNAEYLITNKRTRFNMKFFDPKIGDRDLGAGLSGYYSTVEDSDQSAYTLERVGAEPSLRFPLSKHLRLSLRGRLAIDDVIKVSSSSSPLIQQDLGEKTTSGLGYTLYYDRRNNPHRPSGGFLLSLSQDGTGIGGDSKYLKSTARAKFFAEPIDEVISSLELSGGHIVAFDNYDLRIIDRFVLGGNSFRGFKSSGLGPRDTKYGNSIGGNTYGVARAALSFPLGIPEEYGIHGGLFGNVGTLYNLDNVSYTDGSNTVTVDDDLHWRASVGASIFWSSPVGPMRFDFSSALLKEDYDRDEFFRFSIGTRF